MIEPESLDPFLIEEITDCVAEDTGPAFYSEFHKMKEKVLDKAVHSIILDHPSCQTYLDNERHELMKAIDFKLNFQVAPNRKPKKEEGLEDSDDAPLSMS